ncbi:importin-11 [Fopius arisanus]|uniref:Importin-11 n=2 Tax=Fopius arisanus TaxID=64838 RepID=A0A9R1SX49_9HYME|nr:PREDICTED: importin-11 [Fopius arisanus]
MNASVIEVLQQASSQDPNVFKPAEQMLSEWETQRGFYTTLYNVFSNYSLSVNVRWMAVLCFKNGVDKYWRKTAPNGIAEDEKEFLRKSLLSTFEEPVNQLATHMAVVIGKIARLDCPREWDSLIPTLIDAIGSQNSIAQHRALLILHHVVKTLASKRLAADKQLFEQLTTNMFNFILNLWNTFTESFLILLSQGADEPQVLEALEKALLLLRILRNLLVNGFPNLSKSEDAIMFLKVTFSRAKAALECRKTMMCREMQITSCEKFIIQLTKVMLGTLERHPSCYVELIPSSLEFSVFYCFTEAGQPFVFEKFVIQCLNIMKDILIKPDYMVERPLGIIISKDSDGPKDRLAYRGEQLKEEFFTPEILKEISSWLVTRYFLLTQSDLELWNTDPENYAVDDSRDSWKYSLRPCVESLFLSFFPQFRKQLVSILVELMQRYHQPVDPNDFHGMLLKDAVYHAIGLAASDLYDDVDFNTWFSTTLKQEMKVSNSNYRIVKRRVCWLIGKWIGVNFSGNLRPELYKMIMEALGPEVDLVVRIEASDTLKRALDDWQFDRADFAPYLETSFNLLFNLLREATECDTKMQVLYVISFMIERIGEHIKPYLAAFTNYLPSLWQISEDHNMLRCAIISTLVHYEKALGPESAILEPVIVGMIALSCDMNQDAHVYLLEDGLQLWLALLENTPAITTGVIDLLRNMPALLDAGLDQVTLKPAVYVIQDYVVLSPETFLGDIGASIIEGIKGIMGDLREQDLRMIFDMLEKILKVLPEEGPHIIKPLLPRTFNIIYVSEESTNPRTLNNALKIFARVLLNSREVFSQVVSELTSETGGNATSETVLGRLIEVCAIDHRGLNEDVKLIGLALCSLLDINSPAVVFQQFSKIIAYLTDGLNDIMANEDDSKPEVDTLVYDNCSPGEDCYREDTPEGSVKNELRKIKMNDIVHTVCLRQTLENQMIALRKVMSQNQFDQMIASLKPDINQQLREYIAF